MLLFFWQIVGILTTKSDKQPSRKDSEVHLYQSRCRVDTCNCKNQCVAASLYPYRALALLYLGSTASSWHQTGVQVLLGSLNCFVQ
jgi:hypothetical protein